MNKTLVIIEDDKDLSQLYKELIEYESSFQVELILDGQEALDKLEGLNPDAIMLDLHLPHVSGLDILNYIRENEILHDTPVVVASADMEGLEIAAIKANKVFMKPISLEHIGNIVDTFKALIGDS